MKKMMRRFLKQRGLAYQTHVRAGGIVGTCFEGGLSCVHGGGD